MEQSPSPPQNVSYLFRSLTRRRLGSKYSATIIRKLKVEENFSLTIYPGGINAKDDSTLDLTMFGLNAVFEPQCSAGNPFRQGSHLHPQSLCKVPFVFISHHHRLYLNHDVQRETKTQESKNVAT